MNPGYPGFAKLRIRKLDSLQIYAIYLDSRDSPVRIFGSADYWWFINTGYRRWCWVRGIKQYHLERALFWGCEMEEHLMTNRFFFFFRENQNLFLKNYNDFGFPFMKFYFLSWKSLQNCPRKHQLCTRKFLPSNRRKNRNKAAWKIELFPCNLMYLTFFCTSKKKALRENYPKFLISFPWKKRNPPAKKILKSVR